MATGNFLAGGGAEAMAPFTATAARASKGTDPFTSVILLDASLAEYADTTVFVVPDTYTAAASVKIGIIYAMASATANTVSLSAQLRRHQDGVNGYTRAYPTAVTSTVTVPGTAGFWDYAEITLTSAEADAIAAGESGIIRIGRVGTDATNDTATGDLELIGWYLKEA